MSTSSRPGIASRGQIVSGLAIGLRYVRGHNVRVQKIGGLLGLTVNDLIVQLEAGRGEEAGEARVELLVLEDLREPAQLGSQGWMMKVELPAMGEPSR